MTLTTAPVAAPLAPVTAVLRAVRARAGAAAVSGLVPDLLVTDPTGWLPAAALDGHELDVVLDTARRRWDATAPAAAALAWKSYTFWLALPAVLGWAAARRVPLLDPADVLVRFSDHQPFVTFGLRRATVAVLASDPLAAPGPLAGTGPLAATGLSRVRVVGGEADLLDTFRNTLLDTHLAPLLDRIRQRVRLGHRTLLGSVASAVAYCLIRACDELACSTVHSAATLLGALGLEDLVELRTTGDGRLSVQRKTCCLAFTLPTPKICSGCCLRAAG